MSEMRGEEDPLTRDPAGAGADNHDGSRSLEALVSAAATATDVDKKANDHRMERGAAGSASGKTGCESHDETTVFSL